MAKQALLETQMKSITKKYVLKKYTKLKDLSVFFYNLQNMYNKNKEILKECFILKKILPKENESAIIYLIKFSQKEKQLGMKIGVIKDPKQVLSNVALDEPVKGNELRFEVDRSDDTLGKKIKRATEMKIPVVLIVGPKDAETEQVSVRTRESEEKVKLAELAGWLKEQGEGCFATK